MKKYILTTLSLLSLVACKNYPTTDNNNSTTFSEVTEGKGPKLELIGSYDINAGHLYMYKVGEDTIYLVEGATSAYPVSVSVK